MLFADHFATLPPVGTRRAFVELLSTASSRASPSWPSVRPIDTPELRAIATDWQARVADQVLLVADRGLDQMVAEAGVTLIGYRPLRDAMRQAPSCTRAGRPVPGRCRSDPGPHGPRRSGRRPIS